MPDRPAPVPDEVLRRVADESESPARDSAAWFPESRYAALAREVLALRDAVRRMAGATQAVGHTHSACDGYGKSVRDLMRSARAARALLPEHQGPQHV